MNRRHVAMDSFVVCEFYSFVNEGRSSASSIVT